MKSKTSLNRRSFLHGTAATAVGAKMGLGIANVMGGLLPNGPVLSRLKAALDHASGVGVANATVASDATLVHFVLIDKVQAALFQEVAGPPPTGADANDGIALIGEDFRGMRLTKLFTDPLRGLPDNVGFCINNAWESGTGGHSLINSTLGSAGGVNYAFEYSTGGSGLLGAVGFSLRSDANDSADCFVSPGGIKMQSFRGVNDLQRTLANSIAPLVGNAADLELLKKFDAMATKDAGFRDQLSQLAAQVQSAIPDLSSAVGEEDPIKQQVDAVLALHKAGVCRNFMIAVPYDDTNGGGDLTNMGGSRNLSPFDATPKIAQALVALHKSIPNLFCVATSDGGRGPNNSDQSAGFSFVTGPSDKIKSKIVGSAFSDTSQLGQNFTDAVHSNGESKPTRPANWYATVLKAMGHETDIEFVPDALV
jgi:hypothetical protein